MSSLGGLGRGISRLVGGARASAGRSSSLSGTGGGLSQYVPGSISTPSGERRAVTDQRKLPGAPGLDGDTIESKTLDQLVAGSGFEPGFTGYVKIHTKRSDKSEPSLGKQYADGRRKDKETGEWIPLNPNEKPRWWWEDGNTLIARKETLGPVAWISAYPTLSFYGPEDYGPDYSGDFTPTYHNAFGEEDNSETWRDRDGPGVLYGQKPNKNTMTASWETGNTGTPGNKKDRALHRKNIDNMTPSWELAGGGVVHSYADGGEVIPDKGLTEYGEALVQGAIRALSGGMPEEEAQVILAELVEEFGEGAVEELQQEMQEQAEGGPDGMDDRVQANLTPGELVVSNTQLSDYGNGDRALGADKLMKHLDDVSKAHRGTSKTPRAINPGSLA
jgi:hypothetical protein